MVKYMVVVDIIILRSPWLGMREISSAKIMPLRNASRRSRNLRVIKKPRRGTSLNGPKSSSMHFFVDLVISVIPPAMAGNDVHQYVLGDDSGLSMVMLALY